VGEKNAIELWSTQKKREEKKKKKASSEKKRQDYPHLSEGMARSGAAEKKGVENVRRETGYTAKGTRSDGKSLRRGKESSVSTESKKKGKRLFKGEDNGQRGVEIIII